MILPGTACSSGPIARGMRARPTRNFNALQGSLWVPLGFPRWISCLDASLQTRIITLL
ncbi:hypothetical protein D187_000800 [Cystobacter fuscus DSM 2262]|uniref:Uncharacterized protein n=1 Tax=Cystobacter fuscus (strain ATCC 25194 / DSM 2262 / NBRC 100088 / M29) TaxID=1242864 RepID=S9QVH2_CYSF2|nr:hypothetical protein D187_000800 [Cystobacter fuscus DSM 2262]